MRFTVTQENAASYNRFSSAKDAGMVKFRLLAVLFLMMGGALPASSQDSNSLLASWLNAQTNIQSWSADFTQVRSLKALT